MCFVRTNLNKTWTGFKFLYEGQAGGFFETSMSVVVKDGRIVLS